MKKFWASLAAIAVAVTGGLLSAAPASATKDTHGQDCDTRQVCVYDNFSYNGSNSSARKLAYDGYRDYYDMAVFPFNGPMHDKTSSWKNTCNNTTWKLLNYQGGKTYKLGQLAPNKRKAKLSPEYNNKSDAIKAV